MRRIALLLSVVGFGLSTYLTVEHYDGNTALACPATATISCLKVTTSAESVILGVPVAVLGLVWFAAMIGLTSPPAWRVVSLDRLRGAAAVAGVVMVLWLIYVELFRVDAICLWCTGVHVVTIALMGVILASPPRRESETPAG